MIPNADLYELPTLQALASRAARDFRSIHSDIKWQLGLSAEQVEQMHPTIPRTEVSIGLSTALERMIASGLVTNPTRTHYQITEEGLARLKRSSTD
jgi:hypothetical protein